MFRGLYRFLAAAADWEPRDFLIGAIGAEVVALFAAVSLGFGTFAAYTHLSASEGPVFAATVISTVYGVVAVIAGVTLARWHARSSSPHPTASPAPETLEALLQSLTKPGTPQDQMALIAALRVGRDVSPMELLAISLISGFFAGRNAGR
ncbi:hypothetical protein [Roseomonas sp. HF4]|uniref:hypothetical protein n=1 Tax=Roseomonas sp. HF4 TaxID=2562313 RepID=UPI0010BF6D52|nr:hypothetical protein [Roseomonas sp. HF4]